MPALSTSALLSSIRPTVISVRYNASFPRCDMALLYWLSIWGYTVWDCAGDRRIDVASLLALDPTAPDLEGSLDRVAVLVTGFPPRHNLWRSVAYNTRTDIDPLAYGTMPLVKVWSPDAVVVRLPAPDPAGEFLAALKKRERDTP